MPSMFDMHTSKGRTAYIAHKSSFITGRGDTATEVGAALHIAQFDVPFLVAEIERLREDVKWLREQAELVNKVIA